MYTPTALLGGWKCQECEPGQFCYDNANKSCPPHSVSEGDAKSVLDCFCTAGFSNASQQTEQELCVDCPANSYCKGRGDITPCVTNAVSPTQSRDASKCYCDWGWKGVSNADCVACDSPTFCYGGIEAQCPEGTFSRLLSWDRTNCTCLAGRWGPQGGPCIKCSAGKYNLVPGCVACSDTNDIDCIKCEIGTASKVEGRNSTCDECPKGTFSSPPGTTGATACELCPNGTFSSERAGECTKCPLGWWAATGSTQCTACPENTYLDLEGKGSASDCMKCPQGSISKRQGNSDPSCSKCPAGSYQADGDCVWCKAGSFSRGGEMFCRPCLPGTFSLDNATGCNDCVAGTYSGSNYSSECTQCGAGSFAEFVGLSSCSPCPKGSVSDKDGAKSCSQCLYGQYAASGSSAVSLLLGLKWRVFDLNWPFSVLGLPQRELERRYYWHWRRMH